MTNPKKILAVASEGGHWIQLNRLAPTLDKFDTQYISTFKNNNDFFNKKYFKVIDANMNNKFRLIIQLFQVFLVIVKVRPEIVISTGASVGFFTVVIAKLLNKKTVWIDSVANGDEMSLSGKKVKQFCDVWLTQWPIVAEKEGAQFKGSVL